MGVPVQTEDRGGVELRGRAVECATLDELLSAVRSGRSGALVVRGEAGCGKSALLDYVAARSDGCRLDRAVGVESEMELPYATLHQLCLPVLDRVEELPVPQREALQTAFGLSAGRQPDPFIVGLAVLTLLSGVAETEPLVCIVDDAHWLDHASALALAFVARRLDAESILLVFAERDENALRELDGLPELQLRGLSPSAARELIASSSLGPLDERVLDRIVAESRGNPLALLELPRGASSESLAGGFAPPDSTPLASRIEASFRGRVGRLPKDTQQLLLVGAAEPLGDPVLLWRAADGLGISAEAAGPAEAAELIEVGARVTFCHPLLRSAIYRAASPPDRRRAHEELAAATDPAIDPDRRAWHRAHATVAPNEEVAADLELSAGRAQGRGGLAAAAAFLERSAALTIEPSRRTERALAASAAGLQAGAFEAALGVLTTAETGALDELQRARVDLLRARIAAASSFGTAEDQLLRAAKQLEPLDADLARMTYLEAWGTALAAGELARAGTLRDVSRAVRSAPRPLHEPLSSDLLLDGLAQLIVEGLGPAAPTLRKAVSAFRDDELVLQLGAMAATAAAALWDMEGFHAVITRQLQLAREAGALALLATALQGAGIVLTWRGELSEAASVVAEADAVTRATGVHIAPYGAMLLAAYQGREDEAFPLFKTTIDDATASGEGLGVQYARWATAVLSNGLGHYEEALAAARKASDAVPELFVSHWALAELVEAGVRTGNAGLAAQAADRLVEATRPSGADWGLGIAARSKALASERSAAEPLYAEAIARLGRTPLRPELARAHLLYGEWLRREGRRVDAREQLRSAYEMLSDLGAEAFAERARRELAATGMTVRKRTDETRDQLTAQEQQIARLAASGHTNPEIGAQLFLSPRTVEWHLHKVFLKLDIHSRRELREALPSGAEAA
jgi:DNA-binding CsgD family transcriptional regulator